MHGLINRAIQGFVRDTYGPEAWTKIAQSCDLAGDGFEPMLSYETAVTDQVLDKVAEDLSKPRDMVLEDIGTYLVSHPNTQRIRRLLRFGGDTFVGFLMSLDDLPDRARLAVPDLDLPRMKLIEEAGGLYSLDIKGVHPGFAPVLVGVLRALADDYGSLALLDWEDRSSGEAHAGVVSISLLDTEFAEGRDFLLGAGRTGQEDVA